MAQTAMMMKLTPNICLYDPFAQTAMVAARATGNLLPTPL